MQADDVREMMKEAKEITVSRMLVQAAAGEIIYPLAVKE
jgi:hypothetical protein